MAIKRLQLTETKSPGDPLSGPASMPFDLGKFVHDLRVRLNQVLGYTEIVLDAFSKLNRSDLVDDLVKIRKAAIQLNGILSAELRAVDSPDQPVPQGWLPLRLALSGPINQVIGYVEILEEEAFQAELIQHRQDLQRVSAAAQQFWSMVQGPQVIVPKSVVSEFRQAKSELRVSRTESPVERVGQTLGKILVVDDEELNRDLLRRRLEREGYQIDVASNAKTAATLLAENSYDVMLLDLLMPDTDGFEFLLQIRNDPNLSRLPVIMLSAINDTDRVASCIEAGAEDFLHKPFNSVLLRARIGACLEKKRLRDSEIATLHQLHAEKERLSVTFGSIADAVITTDNTGRITLMNEGAHRLTEWPPSEAIGLEFGEVFRLYPSGEMGLLENVLEIVIERGAPVRFSGGVEIETTEGKRVPIALRAAPLRTEDGLIRGVAVVAHDVTEREQLAQEMLRASKLDSLSLLAGGIAHEYNNILTTIFGQLSLALTENPPPKLAERLQESEKAAFRAKDLTRQLLTFAKGGDPVRKSINIEEVVRSAADFAARTPGVTCEFEFARDLPMVRADADQLSQVIHNLVLNSEQAMGRHGGLIVIKTRPVILTEMRGPVVPGPFVQISVSDNGPGIPPENLSRIFDPFFTTKSHASGLGLSAAHSIARKHAGFIEVESPADHGAIFRVWLPVSNETPKTAPAAFVKGAASGRILVMDDEQSIRKILKEMLTVAGYEVQLAENGEQALQLFEAGQRYSKPFDAIIMDLIIPNGMGGRETILKIREKDALVPVLVSSGYSNDPVMSRHRDFGFDGVLAKPYRMQEMLSVLQELVAKKEPPK